MEESSSQKVVWDGDAKAMQQCLTDIFTSVYTTCDIPENAIFGPCVLSHTSLYDSIAFIALKCTDKRTAPYIFRVDTSAANGTSEGLMWLRLVQSSRDKEEQNLEAYVKNKQLFYRSLRRIEKDEELLVWYGKDLLELLLLSSSKAKMKGSSPYSCQDCNQRFQFEYPFLAHLRFRCTRRLQGSLSPDENVKEISDHLNHNTVRSNPKLGRSEAYSNSQEGKPTTDFHNLARDLENHRSSPKSDQEAEITSEGSNKRKFSELAESRNANLQRLHASKEDLMCTPQQLMGGYIDLEKNKKIFSPTSSEPRESKRSAFTEVKKTSPDLKQNTKNLGPNIENKDSGRPTGSPINKLLNVRQVLMETQVHSRIDGSSLGSAFTSVPQQLCGSSERKSAFSQPSRSFSHLSPLVMTPKLLPTVDCHSSIGDSIPSSRLYQADNLAAKLQSSELSSNCTVQSGIPKQSPFVYATAFWPKTSGPIQLQMPSALTLLPPSFTSLCLPAQNWCAKCNASFRMTSDLVYHMRSHHKKEFAMEPLVKRRREEKLKCPICNESFRERHHLSRHMTSHN